MKPLLLFYNALRPYPDKESKNGMLPFLLALQCTRKQLLSLVSPRVLY
jgi:hypothetical protein